MKKRLVATPVRVQMIPVNGIGNLKQYDHNSVFIMAKIVEGPEAFLDRHVAVQTYVSELVNLLPPEFAEELRKGLNDRFLPNS